MNRDRLLEAYETLEEIQWGIEDALDEINLSLGDPALPLKTHSQLLDDKVAYNDLWENYNRVLNDLETLIDMGSEPDEDLVPA